LKGSIVYINAVYFRIVARKIQYLLFVVSSEKGGPPLLEITAHTHMN
jgi:hypothetical protein